MREHDALATVLAEMSVPHALEMYYAVKGKTFITLARFLEQRFIAMSGCKRVGERRGPAERERERAKMEQNQRESKKGIQDKLITSEKKQRHD